MTAFTLPDAAAWIAGVAAWSSNLFTEFLPFSMMEIGFAAAAVCLLFIIAFFEKGINRIFHKKSDYDKI